MDPDQKPADLDLQCFQKKDKSGYVLHSSPIFILLTCSNVFSIRVEK